MSTPPLPRRLGVEPTRVRLPDDGPWRTMGEYFAHRVPVAQHGRVAEMFAAGEYVDDAGLPVAPDDPVVPGRAIWFHRDLPHEVDVPFEIEILHQDEHLVVVDKPHFLATTPRGRHVRQTVLVRLRERLDLPELSPAHRLDRETAGVLLLTADRRVRGAYQRLFQERRIAKSYLAVAPRSDELVGGVEVRSHLVKERGVHQAFAVADAEPNSHTSVRMIAAQGDLGLYRCVPHTGKTHQIRVHLASLGVPIIGDRLYPRSQERDADDFTSPLQLLAESMRFADPFTGERREFRTRRVLTVAEGPGSSRVPR